MIFGKFQSTRPLRGGTCAVQWTAGSICISIHPPLAGRDVLNYITEGKRNISIHPPLAGRDKFLIDGISSTFISIHPPLAGRDDFEPHSCILIDISIHPPLAGRDIYLLTPSGRPIFQSTRPLRGGTGSERARDNLFQFQSTRPLRGGTWQGWASNEEDKFQSTRPLRGGTYQPQERKLTAAFQSTRPLRGGTPVVRLSPPAVVISIHPPLAGRDPSSPSMQRRHRYFNPPAPCGAGQLPEKATVLRSLFQSTRPLRGGTRRGIGGELLRAISIHPPLAGRDRRGYGNNRYIYSFQSTRPLRGGTSTLWLTVRWPLFQSTRPLRGGTICFTDSHFLSGISIHPPLAGRDR